MSRLHIHYAGLLRSPASWARVGREWVRALVRVGQPVTATSNKGFLYDATFELSPELKAVIGTAPDEAVHVVFEYPPTYPRLEGRPLVGLLTYESTRLPPHWVEPINRCLDLVVVPSRFVRDAAVASGVAGERVAVVPYGFDPERFRPSDATARRPGPFTFLTVATPHRRKGVAEAIQAFGEAFAPTDPVRYIIHTTYVPGQYGALRAWEDPRWPDWLDTVADPPIEIRAGPVSDAELVDLYAVADCCVQPSWGEGFGLSILEGMACGLPVITTGWSGQMDFVSGRTAYLVDYDLVPAEAIQYDSGDSVAQMARPRVEHLADLMRRVRQEPAEAGRRGAAARAAVEHLTWENAARELVRVLEERVAS